MNMNIHMYTYKQINKSIYEHITHDHHPHNHRPILDTVCGGERIRVYVYRVDRGTVLNKHARRIRVPAHARPHPGCHSLLPVLGGHCTICQFHQMRESTSRYTDTGMHIYIYTHSHGLTHTPTHTKMYINTYLCLYEATCNYIYLSIFIGVCVCVCVCVSVCVCVCLCAHTRVRQFVLKSQHSTRVYIYMYLCVY